MSKILTIALGIVTSIGGFLDVGAIGLFSQQHSQAIIAIE